MTGQELATLGIVAAAVAYLVWKVGFSGRKRSSGPDVPTRALLRKTGGKGTRTPGDSGSDG